MKKQSKKGPKVAAKVRASKGEKTGALVPLKKICSDIGIDPKRARVKLRRVWRREDSPGVQFHEKGGRWDLTAAQAREVREILGG